MKPICFLLYFLLILSACKDDSSELIIEKPVIEKPREIFQSFIVIVDNLRMRSNPDLKSEVVDKLKEGAIVTGKNEISDNQETIELRGKTTTAPFYLVNTKGGKSGWTYGGGLKLFYQDYRPSPFTGRMDNFITALNQVDITSNESGTDILKLVGEYKGVDPEWNDAIYSLGNYFHSRLPAFFEFDKDTEKIYVEDYKRIFDRTFDYNSSEHARSLREMGYRLEASEGTIYAVIDENAVARSITGPFSESMQDFVNYQLNRSRTKIYEDGGIAAPINAIVDLAISCERIAMDYPDFILIDKVNQEMEDLHHTILNGSNNTPARDFDTNKIKSEFIDAWKYMMEKYPESKISGYLAERI